MRRLSPLFLLLMLSSDISSGSSHSDSVQLTIATTVNCFDSSELQEGGASEGGASKVWLRGGWGFMTVAPWGWRFEDVKLQEGRASGGEASGEQGSGVGSGAT